MPLTTAERNFIKYLCQSFEKQRHEGKGEEEKRKQEVNGDLSVCVLNLLRENENKEKEFFLKN